MSHVIKSIRVYDQVVVVGVRINIININLKIARKRFCGRLTKDNNKWLGYLLNMCFPRDE